MKHRIQYEKEDSGRAAKYNDLELLKFIHGTTNYLGHYALINAAKYGNVECLKFILENEMFDSGHLEIALTEAIKNDKFNCFKCIVDGRYINDVPLSYISLKRPKYIEYVLSVGIGIHDMNLFHSISEKHVLNNDFILKCAKMFVNK
jgi:hypothetical protein